MDKFVTIKGVRLNITRAVKRIKLDIKDDWFQDPLGYEDVLTPEFIADKVSHYDGKQDNYKAGTAIHIDIPKPGFTSRYSTETNIVDRVMYQALVDFIADDLDKLHSNHIYSHRTNKKRSDDKYFFRYAVEEWKNFINDTQTELESDNNKVLLLTDLTNFYENIAIRDLKDVLDLFTPAHDKGKEYKSCIEMIKLMLLSWCEKNTYRGIPQNRDASSFLANVFLHPVDDTLQKAGFKYFRYMDDIRIVCKSKNEAKKALKCLIAELRKKGLNVNSKKLKF